MSVRLQPIGPLHPRLAAARIVFSREPVVTWEVADGEFGGARGFIDPNGVYINAQIVPALEVYVEAATAATALEELRK